MVPADLGKRKWSQLSDEEIIFAHLCNDVSHLADCMVISTLYRTCSEAQHVRTNIHSNIFVPLLGVFAILDQIGTTYKPKGHSSYPHPNASGIKKALFYFSSFGANDASTKSLYAFRNGLMHGCSFVSHDIKSTPSLHYWFRFDDTITTCVRNAKILWDGNDNSRSDDNLTLINRELLLSLAFEMVCNLRKLYDNGQLDIAIPGGAQAIAANFLVRSNKKQSSTILPLK